MSGSRSPSPGQGALVLPTPEENQNEFADHYDHVDVYDRDDAVDGEVYQVRSVRSGPLLLLGPCVPARVNSSKLCIAQLFQIRILLFFLEKYTHVRSVVHLGRKSSCLLLPSRSPLPSKL